MRSGVGLEARLAQGAWALPPSTGLTVKSTGSSPLEGHVLFVPNPSLCQVRRMGERLPELPTPRPRPSPGPAHLPLATTAMAAAAAAKSLQSCLTLCDPIDGNPPGSPVPGILQAKTLEWVAISFSNACK